MAPKDTNYKVKDRIYLDGDGRPTKNARKGVKLYAIPGQEIPLAQAREIGLLGDGAAAEEADRKRREEEKAKAEAEAAEADRLERERREQEERDAEDVRRAQEQSAQLSKDAAEKAEAERKEREEAEAAAGEPTIDLARANHPTLKAEAERLGLDADGTKAQLRGRIEEHNEKTAAAAAEAAERAELEQEANQRGLDTDGSNDEIRERIEAHDAAQPGA